MPFRIRNWKLALLALGLICLFMRLSYWQLSRAQEKTLLLNTFHARNDQSLTTEQLSTLRDVRYYQTTLTGTFDNAHQLLLDNKIFHGTVGYEIYTPFYVQGIKQPILVDRGFIPLGHSRQQLPNIKSVNGIITITGLLSPPLTYISLGKMQDNTTWPRRVEFLDLKKLADIFQTSFYPYLLIIKPTDPAAYPIEWKIFSTGPERNQGYAVQWFAFALTLLILFFVLNRQPKNKKGAP